jgi:hypothetical protein
MSLNSNEKRTCKLGIKKKNLNKMFNKNFAVLGSKN